MRVRGAAIRPYAAAAMSFFLVATSTQCMLVNVPRVSDATVSVIGDLPEIISQPVEKAYPGIEYNTRLAVIGGIYPYTFSLDGAPEGMAISDNGTISWSPGAELSGRSFPVTVKVIDSAGKTATQGFELSVTANGFHFIAPDGDDAAGSGSIDSPWATINKGLAEGATGDTVYVRGGTYLQRWAFVRGKANRLVAYPGESPIADFGFERGPFIYESGACVDGFEIKNIVFKAFQVEGAVSHLVFRRNHMHDLYDNSVSENPSFVFFWDDSNYHYDNVVFQENVFHDLFDRGSGLHGDDSANGHGGSTVWYNVRNSLYEDNEAYRIDDEGMKDKDHGYRNTIRKNVIHDCGRGIGLYNQGNQMKIEVDHNLVYDCGNSGVVLGGQPGFLKDVAVHHNTIVGGLCFSGIVDVPESGRFVVFNNIVGNGTDTPYLISPMRVDDEGGRYHYEYPNWFQTRDMKVCVADNLVWASAENVAGYGWGIPLTDWATWRARLYDVNGVLGDPGLDENHSLDPASPYYGVYGR